jgi:hypothetical protein
MEYQSSLLVATLGVTFVLILLTGVLFEQDRFRPSYLSFSWWIVPTGIRGLVGWGQARRGERVSTPHEKHLVSRVWLPVLMVGGGLPMMLYLLSEEVVNPVIPLWYKLLMVAAFNAAGWLAVAWAKSAVEHLRARRTARVAA